VAGLAEALEHLLVSGRVLGPQVVPPASGGGRMSPALRNPSLEYAGLYSHELPVAFYPNSGYDCSALTARERARHLPERNRIERHP
jgi:hypothetical protein